MTGTITVSTKFQVVIPKETRNRLHIKAGNKLAVIEKWGQIILVPVKPVHKLRGIAKGIDLEGIRDEGDRI